MGVSNVDILKANSVIAPQVMNTTGRVFFVNNATSGLPAGAIGGSNGNSGASPLEPFSTIDFAIGQCTANRGDVVYVMPGHSEALSAAAGIDLDVAGVSVIGLGNGRNRPNITISGTDDATDIDIAAANCRFSNFFLDFTGNDSITAAMDIDAADCKVDHCEILAADSGGQVDDLFILDANADRFELSDCVIDSTNAGAGSALTMVATAPDGVKIKRNVIFGDFSNACIFGSSTPTNLDISDNYLQNDQNGDHAIELSGNATGSIRNNHLVTDAVATAIDPGTCNCTNNWYSDDGISDAPGIPVPVADIQDSAANFLGDDSSNNTAATTNVAANADGSVLERLEFLQDRSSERVAISNYNFGDDTGAQQAYTIYTVTGDVLMKVFGVCDIALTSGGAATIELGVSGNTAVLIAQSTATDLIANEIWHDASPTTTVEQLDVTGAREFVITNGQDVIFTIGSADLTAGDVDFYALWRPLSSDGNVVAA